MKNLDSYIATPLDIKGLIISLLVAAMLSFVVQLHYRYFSRSLAARKELAVTFPLVTLTTLLVIAVIKSSLALSLGMIGALSIVRFRTPIKEPEELAYLFLSIAVGVGLGAEQLLPTTVVTAGILVISAIFQWRFRVGHQPNVVVSVSCAGIDAIEARLAAVTAAVAASARASVVRRIDTTADSLHATYIADEVADVAALITAIRTSAPTAEVTVMPHVMPAL